MEDLPTELLDVIKSYIPKPVHPLSKMLKPCILDFSILFEKMPVLVTYNNYSRDHVNINFLNKLFRYGEHIDSDLIYKNEKALKLLYYSMRYDYQVFWFDYELEEKIRFRNKNNLVNLY